MKRKDAPTRLNLQVLERVAAGATPKELGAELGVTDAAVNHHLSRWRRISGCRTNVQLGIWALLNGYVLPPPGSQQQRADRDQRSEPDSTAITVSPRGHIGQWAHHPNRCSCGCRRGEIVSAPISNGFTRPPAP